MFRSGLSTLKYVSRHKNYCLTKHYCNSAKMDGKVALITGGAKGLGRAFAEALLDKGAKVCISDVNASVGIQTEAELREKYQIQNVFFHKCDVTSEADLESALKETVERYGHLDILCNNAGIGNEDDWKLMMAINLSAVIQNTMLALKYMGKAAGRQNGVIVNISSAAGLLPMPFGPVYTAVKHGVLGYTRSIGVLSPKMFGVRINCLCPSFANTDILKINDSSFFVKGAEQFAKQMIAMVGVMKPSEVANSFMELVENEKLSAATMFVTPNGKSTLRMPKTIDEAFAVYSKI